MTKLLQSEDKIIVGRLGKVRGLNGEIKIISLTDFEGRFDNLKEIFVDDKMMKIERVKNIGGEIFIKFQNIDSREVAKTLTNKFLTVPRADAAPLEDGEFYTFDIIGCEVFDGEKFFGKVENVLKTGSNDVFQVIGESEILVPALKSFVREIDIANKKIFINSAALEAI
jgi:16S rRNA processing protein RimM